MNPSRDQIPLIGTATPDRCKDSRNALATEGAQIGWLEGRNFLAVEAKVRHIGSGGATYEINSEGFWPSKVWLCVPAPCACPSNQAYVAENRDAEAIPTTPQEPPEARRGPVAIALEWLLPTTLCVSTALMIVVLVYMTWAEPRLIAPLVACLGLALFGAHGWQSLATVPRNFRAR